MKTLRSDIKEFLERLAQQSKLTGSGSVAEFCRFVGISRATYYNMIRQRHCGLDTMQRIVNAYGLSSVSVLMNEGKVLHDKKRSASR